ncbi:hypothetical protein SEA_MISCHIEF19_71 [Streptomyces phage Mischief19]|nr:hypothetical protein SEA_MISCHIEF19_71 [Streptomyces phage Mischief19]
MQNVKVTKTQRATLVKIWTERTAAGMVSPDGNLRTLIGTRTATKLGFAKLNGNACSSLLGKGLIKLYKTSATETYTSYGKVYTMHVQVAVLTDLGREVIGV